jgi:hypothetical protein
VIALAISLAFLAGAAALWCVLWVVTVNARTKASGPPDLGDLSLAPRVGLWRWLTGDR